jgi:hypothetical protein
VRGARAAAAHLTRTLRRLRPQIMLSMEGSSDAPMLVFETRGCASVCACRPFFLRNIVQI